MPEQGGGTNGDHDEHSAGPSQPPQERPHVEREGPDEARHAMPPEAGESTEPLEPARPAAPIQPAVPSASPAQPQGSFSAESAPSSPPSGGSIRWQQAGVTTPRQPTVAEARHRDRVRKASEEAERYAAEQERQQEERSAKRRKVLIGSGVVVGLVGAVALGYALLNNDREVSASCVKDGTNEVVPDNYCASGLSSGGGGGGGGVFIYAGSPYRYYYGGSNGGVGSIARGGTIELPKGTTGKTKSGSSISRGGFGSSSHSSSGS